jgi:twitching motility protein PilI
VRGLANVHGTLLQVIDLRQYLGGGPTPQTRQMRILVANHREVPAGFLVDEVLGFRRFAEAEFSGATAPTLLGCEQYLAGAFRRGAEQWPVLSLRLLVENPGFLDAAA